MARSIWILFIFVFVAQAFQLPDINDLFGSFKTWKSSKGNKHADDVNHERVKRSGPTDSSQLPHESITYDLPRFINKSINFRYMPTLGNGHMSVTVYDDRVHINGLYSGEGSRSHRVKIPAVVMSRVILEPDHESLSTRRFIMNVEDGVFMETIDTPFAFIEHRMYVHQRYIRCYVSDIYARRKAGSGIINLQYPDITDTPDIDFEEPRRHRSSDWRITGTTKEPEEGGSVETIHVFWQEPLRQISLRSSVNEVNETIIMSIDRSEGNAQSDFNNVMNIIEDVGGQGHYNLLREHIESWHRIWNDWGRVDVEGALMLSKVTRFSQYYILSSLPSPTAHLATSQADYFHGMGRTSLAKGSDHRDYQGHILWDSEMYVLPAVLPFHPHLAKEMLRYRAEKAEEAQQIAASMGSPGYKYPWASASSGFEVSPDVDTCGSSCVLKRHHNTGAVSWAMRQYFSMTRDWDFVTSSLFDSCDMTREIARFYAERAVYNPQYGRYDLLDMTGPDLFHPDVDNNAYTVVLASLAIHWARYYACVCNRHAADEVPDEWIHRALYLNLPYDNVKRAHPQFEGFDDTVHRPIRQADAIMLTYPLNWNMSRDIMKNDLLMYEQITSDRTPSMTWSFFAVGFKWVGEEARHQQAFYKSYNDYMETPFYIWTEYNERGEEDMEEGSTNFLPGMGGFLQSIVYGHAGLRVRPQYLEFHDPRPPQGSTRIRLSNFHYLGARMTITVETSHVDIEIHSIHEHELVLTRNDTIGRETHLPPGTLVRIDNPQFGFFISGLHGDNCPHPRDFIYMPWGYSPWIAGASLNSYNLPLTVSMLITVLMIINKTIH